MTSVTTGEGSARGARPTLQMTPSPTTPADRRLLERARAGDPSAFERRGLRRRGEAVLDEARERRSAGTVASRLNRARAALRPALAGYGEVAR